MEAGWRSSQIDQVIEDEQRPDTTPLELASVLVPAEPVPPGASEAQEAREPAVQTPAQAATLSKATQAAIEVNFPSR